MSEIEVDAEGQARDDALARELSVLGRRLDYPPTPDMAASVRAALAAGQVRHDSGRPKAHLPRLRPALLAAAAALMALAASVIAFPVLRSTAADWFGVRGARISRVATIPPAATSPASAPTTTEGIPGDGLGLGERVTLGQAQARVSFMLMAPSPDDLPPPPDAVYVSAIPSGGQVSYVYRTRATLPPTAEPTIGLLLSQFRGTLDEIVIRKLLGPDTQLETVAVNGGTGFWIAGAPHAFFYRDASGNVQQERLRLAGNTLLWERDGVSFRLESALPQDAALRIAAGMAPLTKK